MIDPVTAVRFAINGLVATAAHFSTLVILIEMVGLPSAGLSNGLASVVGIAVSYYGNRSYVFRSSAPSRVTLPRFIAVYAVVALIHGLGLAIWTDLMGLPYQLGFLFVTALSLLVTFAANRLFVFRETSVSPSER